MARGKVGVSAAQGTGAHVSMQPSPKGPKASVTTQDVSTSKSYKPTTNASQKTTTAPTVKAPSVTLVTDTKPRTQRERLVDAYNTANPAHSGGRQFETALEMQLAKIAEAEKQAGTETGYRKNKAQ